MVTRRGLQRLQEAVARVQHACSTSASTATTPCPSGRTMSGLASASSTPSSGRRARRGRGGVEVGRGSWWGRGLIWVGAVYFKKKIRISWEECAAVYDVSGTQYAIS